MAPPIRKSWVELTQESSTIQQEMDAIQSRLTEIAEQKRELAGEGLYLDPVAAGVGGDTVVGVYLPPCK